MSNRAFQSWSPRTRPLEYDSLQQDIGCQVTTGTQQYATLPFIQICIAEHDLDPASIYNQSDKISYTIGPHQTGQPMPWITPWVAWVSNTGVRVMKNPPAIILPAQNTGGQSNLYPTRKPTSLSIGFTANGQMAIAIQKTATAIEIKWFRDGTGLNIGTYAFSGIQPALFNNGLVFVSDDADETDLVLFYLRPETPRVIYARFERDDFATEYVINGLLQANLAKLIDSKAEGGKQVLYARDEFGRDVVLRSEDYAIRVDGDQNTLTQSIVSGSYNQVAVLAPTIPTEHNTLTCSIVSGFYADPIQEPAAPLSGDAATLTLSIVSGEYV